MSMDVFGSWRQYLVAFACNVATLSFGLQTGWLSPLQPSLQSDNSPLGSDAPPLTDEEISWIGSMPSFTLILAPPVFGWCLDRFGRRITLFLMTAPNLLNYLLLIFANNVYIVYVARLIGGFCSCGGFIVGPIYLNECVEPKLKGLFGGLMGFFIKLGIIFSYILGAYTSYLTLNIFSMSFTVAFLVAYPFIPESPEYLMKIGKYEEASDVLKSLWGPSSGTLVEEEVKRIRNNADTPQRVGWKLLKNFFTDRKLRTGSLICMSVFGFQMLSGYPAIVRYTVDIFSSTGTTYSPYLSAIILAVSQLVFAFIGAFLLDRMGRKTLVVACLSIMAVCLAVLSAYLYAKADYPDLAFMSKLNLLPIISLVIFIGGYGAAFGTVPFVIIPELFTTETRAVASTMLNLWFAFTEFVVVKFFYTVKSWVGFSGSLAIFSVIGFVGVVVLQLIMIETKGLNSDMVQLKLSGKKDEVEDKREVDKLLPKPKTRQHC